MTSQLAERRLFGPADMSQTVKLLHDLFLDMIYTNEDCKKAMYYSICGHAYNLLGCVDKAKEAFERAKKCNSDFPTYDLSVLECSDANTDLDISPQTS